MRVLTIPLNDDNFGYILSNEETGNAAVIDVSNQPGQIAAALYENGLNLKMILTTHKHWDHANGNDEMKTIFPGLFIPLYYFKMNLKLSLQILILLGLLLIMLKGVRNL